MSTSCSHAWASLSLLAIALAARPSAAQTAGANAPSNVEQAQAKFEESDALYLRGDYEGALQRLKEAYALFPSPKIHLGFGHAYRALGRPVEALEAYERYLAEVPSADPAKRQMALTNAEELRKKVGSVDVRCDTAGAQVSLDGREVGETPLARPLYAAPGRHRIVVRRWGESIFQEDVFDLGAGQTVRIDGCRRPPIPAAAPTPPHARPTSVALAPARPQPNPTRADLATAPAPQPADAAGARPLYGRWWFWAGATVLLGGAVAGVILATRNTEPAPICGPECNLGVHRLMPP